MSIKHSSNNPLPNIRSRSNFQTTGPNAGERSYVKGGDQLTPQQLSARLHRVDWSPSSVLMKNAQSEARRSGVDARELLHQAIARAMRPAVSRPDIPVVPYLTMLMKSIGSGILQARAKARERGSTIPFDCVAEQVPDTRSIVDPFATLVRRDERAFYERILGQVVEGDPQLEALVDGIDFGQRGRVLQIELGLSEGQLATLRRRLKRKVQVAFATAPKSALSMAGRNPLSGG